MLNLWTKISDFERLIYSFHHCEYSRMCLYEINCTHRALRLLTPLKILSGRASILFSERYLKHPKWIIKKLLSNSNIIWLARTTLIWAITELTLEIITVYGVQSRSSWKKVLTLNVLTNRIALPSPGTGLREASQFCCSPFSWRKHHGQFYL